MRMHCQFQVMMIMSYTIMMPELWLHKFFHYFYLQTQICSTGTETDHLVTLVLGNIQL